MWVITIIAFYLSLQFFALPEFFSDAITGLAAFALVYQSIAITLVFVAYATKRFIDKDEDGDGEIDPNAVMMSNMATMIARIVLWLFGGIFILSSLGIEVTALIAGLGIGGIAIAFALQGVLTDLFASFSIYFDQPFSIGDYIVIGADSGNVEKIGIKSTRIRTLQGEELVVSNTELTTARVQNFRKLDERRVVIHFGVTYETSQETLENMNTLVTDIVNTIEGVRFDRSHINNFADSSLEYEVVFYVESTVYADYMDAQQEFRFKLVKAFAKEGIDFAYPTQMTYNKEMV